MGADKRKDIVTIKPAGGGRDNASTAMTTETRDNDHNEPDTETVNGVTKNR
jgi:hypothetical protein